MKRWLRWLVGGLVVVLLALQAVPVDRSNPPVEQTVDAPPEVLAVLRRSCFDCHSHETRWPWYSRVAPASWLVAHDVAEARDHLNFSTWNRYSPRDRADFVEEAWEEVSQGEMPLWYYLPAHPSARLSEADRALIRGWAGAGSEASAEEAAEVDDGGKRRRRRRGGG
jgi:hypothetical protein